MTKYNQQIKGDFVTKKQQKLQQMSELAQQIEHSIFTTSSQEIKKESLEKKLYDSEQYIGDLFEQNEELLEKVKALEAELLEKNKKIKELTITVQAVRKLVA